MLRKIVRTFRKAALLLIQDFRSPEPTDTDQEDLWWKAIR